MLYFNLSCILITSYGKIIEPLYDEGLYFEQYLSCDSSETEYFSELGCIYCLYDNYSDSHIIKGYCHFLENDLTQNKISFYIDFHKDEKLKLLREVNYFFYLFDLKFTRNLMKSEMNEDSICYPPDLRNEMIAEAYGHLIESIINFYKPFITSETIEKISKLISSSDPIDSLLLNLIKDANHTDSILLYSQFIQSYNSVQENCDSQNESAKFTEQKRFLTFIINKVNIFVNKLHDLLQIQTGDSFRYESLNPNLLFYMLFSELHIHKAFFLNHELDFDKGDYNMTFLDRKKQVIKQNIKFIVKEGHPIIILYSDLKEKNVRYICFNNENEEEPTLLDIKKIIHHIKRS